MYYYLHFCPQTTQKRRSKGDTIEFLGEKAEKEIAIQREELQLKRKETENRTKELEQKGERDKQNGIMVNQQQQIMLLIQQQLQQVMQ